MFHLSTNLEKIHEIKIKSLKKIKKKDNSSRKNIPPKNPPAIVNKIHIKKGKTRKI
jgi:hypothetical protein